MNNNQNVRRRVLVFIYILALVVIMGTVATFAWFYMSRENMINGIKMEGVPAVFEIRTSGSDGLYDDYLSQTGVTYAGSNITSGSSQNIAWKLTSASQMENLYAGNGEPDLAEIKKLESDEYGLSPGDHGEISLTFVPNVSDEINVSVKLKKTFFGATYNSDGYQIGQIQALSENVDAAKYASSHIQFFYTDDSGTQKLITDDGFTVMLANSEKTVTIYWVWPERLSNIFDKTVAGLVTNGNGQTELRRWFFSNPNLFLSNLTSAEANGIMVADGTENAETVINEMVNSIKADARTYSNYSGKYNGADQIIADNVAYVIVELIADIE